MQHDPGFLPAEPFVIEGLRDAAGCYMFYVKGGAELLRQLGYLDLSGDMPPRIDGADLFYVGASDRSVRARVKQHLRADARASTFRESLGCVLATSLPLQMFYTMDPVDYFFGEDEIILTDWMRNHLLVRCYYSPDAENLEKFLIGSLAAPFNLNGRRLHPFAKHLMALRKASRKSAVPLYVLDGKPASKRDVYFAGEAYESAKKRLGWTPSASDKR